MVLSPSLSQRLGQTVVIHSLSHARLYIIGSLSFFLSSALTLLTSPLSLSLSLSSFYYFTTRQFRWDGDSAKPSAAVCFALSSNHFYLFLVLSHSVFPLVLYYFQWCYNRARDIQQRWWLIIDCVGLCRLGALLKKQECSVCGSGDKRLERGSSLFFVGWISFGSGGRRFSRFPSCFYSLYS